jgi:hypothetical protein
MMDCANVDMRDRLPELANGRGSGASLVDVRAHVAQCVDCQEELRLLEQARAVVILSTPRIDVARIASAIPGAALAPRRSSFSWRIAASIVVLAVGGGAATLMYSGHSSPVISDTISLVSEPVGASASDFSVAGDLSGLTDEQLQALVGRVDQLDALPSAEVRPSTQLSGVMPVTNVSKDNPDSGAM